MEYCEGGSVLDVMNATRETLKENLIFIILSQVLKGLEFLHSHKILHRDIKVPVFFALNVLGGKYPFKCHWFRQAWYLFSIQNSCLCS
jgi:serine/threonine protein kinase